MKQKVVIRVQMEDDKKRAKAMKKAVERPGVLSAAIEGADKNQIVVIEDGVDSIALTTSLRKLMGFAELVSVGAVEEKKPDQPGAVWPSYSYTKPPYHYIVQQEGYHCQVPGCSIM